MTESLQTPALLPEPLQNSIRQMLAQSRLWCRIPSPLRKDYLEQRRLAFRAMLRTVATVVLALLALIIIVGWGEFEPDLSSADGRSWWHMIAISGAIYALLIPACRLPAVNSSHVPVVTLASTLLVGVQLLTAMVVQQHRFAQALTYVCMISDFVVMLAWRLPAVAGALACLGGLLLATVLAHWQGTRPDWPLLLTYHGGAVIYLFMISLAVERADRINFLRGVLIRQDTRLRETLTQRLDSQHQQLEKLVLQDALTGLANRRHFDLQLSREWERLRREREPLAVLFIDVDHFKYYNDCYGHGAGDQCLAQVGATLQRCAQRPADLAARYGGEEFVMLLPGTNAQGARLVAERVVEQIDALAMPHARSPVSARLTVSVGCVATVPVDGHSTLELLKAADEALYAAKQSGRHCVREQGPSLAESA